jgi:1-acyl-sn-glycerol-3-phosphate acyltransferase
MMRILSKIIFWVMGWEAIGTFDYPKKCIVVAAPHTSNWDFLIGRCYGYISGVNSKYLIKSSFFIPVLGILFKWNGGIPVYRDSKNNLVDQIAERFNNSENFRLGISPEGTRSRVGKWKTGFYHIAHKAKVPILLLAMDFKNKKIGIINSLIPTGDIDKDMIFIQNQFKDINGRIPEHYNPIIR